MLWGAHPLIVIGGALFVWSFLWLLRQVEIAPLLDEVFPIEDRPTTRGGETVPMPLIAENVVQQNAGDIPSQDEITFHTGAE